MKRKATSVKAGSGIADLLASKSFKKIKQIEAQKSELASLGNSKKETVRKIIYHTINALSRTTRERSTHSMHLCKISQMKQIRLTSL